MVGPPGGDGVFSGCGGARLLPSADTERPAKRFHPPARNPAPATLRVEAGPALDVRAGDAGGFSGPPSAANQIGRRRGALAVRSRLKRIAAADDRKSARRRGEPAHSTRGRQSPAAARMRAWVSAARPRRRAALIISRLTLIP